MGEHRADVVGDRTHADEHVVGVLGVVRDDRGVVASGQFPVLGHRLAHELGHGVGEVRAVVGGAGLEVGLVLDRAGEARVVRVDEGGDALAGSPAPGAEPLATPLAVEVGRKPGERLLDEFAGVVGLDAVGEGVQLGAERGHVVAGDGVAVPVEVAVELEDAALGAEEEILGDGGALDPARGVAEVLGEQFGLGHERLAHHVACREAVHGVGHGDEAQRGRAVGDGCQVGGLLRVGTEQDRVAGGEEGVHVVVTGHHVQRVAGDHAGGDVKDEAADLLADRHVV